jgi:hypothetical protein
MLKALPATVVTRLGTMDGRQADTSVTANMLKSDRDFLILELKEIDSGAEMGIDVECPDYGEQFKAMLDISDFFREVTAALHASAVNSGDLLHVLSGFDWRLDPVPREAAVIAYHLRASRAERMDLSRPERAAWIEEIKRINKDTTPGASREGNDRWPNPSPSGLCSTSRARPHAARGDSCRLTGGRALG